MQCPSISVLEWRWPAAPWIQQSLPLFSLMAFLICHGDDPSSRNKSVFAIRAVSLFIPHLFSCHAKSFRNRFHEWKTLSRNWSVEIGVSPPERHSKIIWKVQATQDNTKQKYLLSSIKHNFTQTMVFLTPGSFCCLPQPSLSVTSLQANRVSNTTLSHPSTRQVSSGSWRPPQIHKKTPWHAGDTPNTRHRRFSRMGWRDQQLITTLSSTAISK
jgi:hypothetical protein